MDNAEELTHQILRASHLKRRYLSRDESQRKDQEKNSGRKSRPHSIPGGEDHLYTALPPSRRSVVESSKEAGGQQSCGAGVLHGEDKATGWRAINSTPKYCSTKQPV